ncbi:PilZ domain-containing protein [Mucisphaera calidilacus]|uniref:PilZ domain protein n=1 Tax=Mucisphaera calidilacus TaxID=2527982 RepID=A0A518BWQ3_9BACT|nr:PilZ domain-containing protein [Mucisphaera calidilacus]QDU71405.1 PilZ domain protein [Mucisphaera calidilacus]
MTDNKNQDRRRHPRWPIEKPVKVRDRTTGRYLAGQSLDASWSGIRLRFTNPTNLRPGQTVDVSLPDDAQRGFLRSEALIPAAVVRVDNHDTIALRLGIDTPQRQAA